MNDNIYETLKGLIDNERKKEPSYIYLDKQTNQIKEIPLKDSSASALIHKTVKQYKNPAKEIHDSIFFDYRQ